MKKFVHEGREYAIHWVTVDRRCHAAVFQDGKQLTRNEGMNIDTSIDFISPGKTALETFVNFIETEFKQGRLRVYIPRPTVNGKSGRC
jgi:hypothetical protein